VKVLATHVLAAFSTKRFNVMDSMSLRSLHSHFLVLTKLWMLGCKRLLRQPVAVVDQTTSVSTADIPFIAKFELRRGSP